MLAGFLRRGADAGRAVLRVTQRRRSAATKPACVGYLAHPRVRLGWAGHALRRSS